jgi:hypothetical protein
MLAVGQAKEAMVEVMIHSMPDGRIVFDQY